MTTAANAPSPHPAPPRERAAFTRLLVLASASWVRLALTFLVGFVMTPIMLRAWGVELFGIYALVALTINTADPISVLLNKACNRELTSAHSSRDPARMRRVFTNAVLLACAGALAVSLIPLLLAAFAPALLNYQPSHDKHVRTAILVEGANIAFAVITTPWSNLFWATQRFVLENSSRVLSRLLDLSAALLSLALPYDKFYSFIFLRCGLQTALNASRCIVISRLTPAARFRPADADARLARSMAGAGGWALGDFVGRFGFYDSDHILLNYFRGPVYNAINSIVNTIRGYTRLIGVSMLFGVESIAADLHEKGRADTLRRVLLSSTAQCFALVGFTCVIAGAFFGPLLDCWLGKTLRADAALAAVMSYEDARRFAWLFLLIGLPGLLFGESHTGASNVLYGMGLIRKYAPVVMSVSALRVVAVITLLALHASPLSLPLVTTIGLLLVYAGYYPVLICRTTGAQRLPFLWRVYGRPLLSLLPVALAAYTLSTFITSWSLFKIALCCGALGALYAPLALFIVLGASERGRVLDLAAPLLSRVGLFRSREAAKPVHLAPAPADEVAAAEEAMFKSADSV